MIEITNECVDCGLPCVSWCPHKRVVRYYCDRCKEEVDALYDYDGEQLCGDCVLSEFEKVEADD